MKKKILTYFVYIIIAAIVVTTAAMAILTYNLFEDHVIESLRLDARVIAAFLQKGGKPEQMPEMDGEIRLTLIRPDGTVTFDSIADSAAMGSHLERPEVRSAMLTGEGQEVRKSKTVSRNTFYYALRMENGDILRVAEEASNILNIYIRSTPLILIVMALMIALCLYAAQLLTARLLRPIEQMTAHLDSLSGVARYPELEPFMAMIEKQHTEIMKSADMRVEFTANVSHELKTPLTSISGYAELIESGMAHGEQSVRFAGEIHKSANRLLTLIDDIIRLSQMDSPEQRLSLESVRLDQVAGSVVEQLRMNAQRLDVSVTLETRPCFVSADRRMMEELIYNLLDNAIRYNLRGGNVYVSVHPVRDQVVVCVQDTGIGIPKEHQEHIFERFYRVDKSRSKATGGTGLGLAIVKHIAAKHHASISVDSEVGRGTAITVTFERLQRG